MKQRVTRRVDEAFHRRADIQPTAPQESARGTARSGTNIQRATPDDVLGLQRGYGNRAMNRLISRSQPTAPRISTTRSPQIQRKLNFFGAQTPDLINLLRKLLPTYDITRNIEKIQVEEEDGTEVTREIEADLAIKSKSEEGMKPTGVQSRFARLLKRIIDSETPVRINLEEGNINVLIGNFIREVIDVQDIQRLDTLGEAPGGAITALSHEIWEQFQKQRTLYKLEEPFKKAKKKHKKEKRKHKSLKKKYKKQKSLPVEKHTISEEMLKESTSKWSKQHKKWRAYEKNWKLGEDERKAKSNDFKTHHAQAELAEAFVMGAIRGKSTYDPKRTRGEPYTGKITIPWTYPDGTVVQVTTQFENNKVKDVEKVEVEPEEDIKTRIFEFDPTKLKIKNGKIEKGS